MTQSSELVSHALADPVNAAVLRGLKAMGLPDCWLVSGCVFQAVWNGLTGRAPGYGVNDYDVFYFDPDTSWAAEDAVIARCAEVFHSLGAEIQVRNQARVHVWYAQKFGRPYPPLSNATEALSRFLAPCCAVGLRMAGDRVEVAAPFGLDDIFAIVVRPNRLTTGPQSQYEAKAARWRALWPELTVRPWTD